MAISDDENPSAYHEHDSDFEEDEESDWEDGESDSDVDSSYSVFEETRATFSNLSVLKKSSSRTRNTKDLEAPEIALSEVNEKSYEKVQEIVKAGQLGNLKVDQCKVYLRKNGLRLSGNKDTLIQRIREHLEILDGEGDRKYPPSSFVLNCKGDACMGDVVMFEQNVYDMYNIASRSASGPPCCKRTVVGRIVKESYGSAKQQHTFTIEVLWSKGEKPLPPLYPLLIKGRNLYRLKTLRQRWKDEDERLKFLNEKHWRGYFFRSDREVRVQEKERRKNLKKNSIGKKEEPNKSQPLSKPTAKAGIVHFQKSGTSTFQAPVQNPVSFICLEKPKPILQQPGFPQPGFTLQPSCRPQSANSHQQPYNNLNQLVQNPVNRSSIREAHMQNSDHYHSNYTQTGSDARRYYERPICLHPEPDFVTKFPRWDNSRQPLRDMNYGHPARRPQAFYQQRQPCHYFAQGRCYFGDSCKFSHEPSSHVQPTVQRF